MYVTKRCTCSGPTAFSARVTPTPGGICKCRAANVRRDACSSVSKNDLAWDQTAQQMSPLQLSSACLQNVTSAPLGQACTLALIQEFGLDATILNYDSLPGVSFEDQAPWPSTAWLDLNNVCRSARSQVRHDLPSLPLHRSMQQAPRESRDLCCHKKSSDLCDLAAALHT